MESLLSRRLRAAFFGSTLSLLSATTWASGFQIFEYNGAGMGNYQAGGAAIADDASTTFANPAGLTRIANQQVVSSGVYISAKSDFRGGACGGVAATGCTLLNTSGTGGTEAVVPAFHYALPLSHGFVFGFGLTGPFGLATNYGKETALRYSATRSAIETINANPSLAYKVTDKISLGVGANYQYMDAKLDANVNFFPGLGFPDSELHNDADDWSWGWNVGAMYEMSENTRFGISFRSQVSHHLEGKSELKEGIIPSLRTDVTADVRLPPTTMASIYHSFAKEWAVMATIAYTKWDTIKELVLKNAAVPGLQLPAFRLVSAPGDITLPQDYKNTWRAAGGLDYMPNEKWRFRIGGGYDETPVNTLDRTIRLPDTNRIAVALGVQYKPKEQFLLDAGFTHLFMSNSKINQNGTLSRSVGISENGANLLGLQITWNIV